MIKILCVGKIKEKYLDDLINDYEKELIALKEKIKLTDYNIALDIKGKEVTSVTFAEKLDKCLMNYGNITFIIGPSLGLDEKIKNLANECLSFSSLTFPHGLFRGLLLEQIYRAFKILNNESYHK